jgi:hypothetical protein
MRSIRLAREVSASHDKSGSDWCVGSGRTTQAQGASTTIDAWGGTIPHDIQVKQLAAMQAAHPDKSLNAGLTG